MVMNAFDTNFDAANEVYAVNTVAFHYMKHPLPIEKSRPVRIYLVNLTEFDLINSFHLHANFFDYYDTGTQLEPTLRTVDTIMQAQGQRGILEFRYDDEDHDPGLLAHPGLVFLFVRRIEIWGRGFEFPGAGIDHLVDRSHAKGNARFAHGMLGGSEQCANLAITECCTLGRPQQLWIELVRCGRDLALDPHKSEQLLEKPFVDLRPFVNGIDRDTASQRRHDGPKPLIVWFTNQTLDLLRRPFRIDPGEVAGLPFQRAYRFLQSPFEGPIDRHHLSGRLHLRIDGAIGARELVEWPARDLDDGIVERWLEGRSAPQREPDVQFERMKLTV